MSLSRTSLAALALVVPALGSAVSVAAQTSLTIYNDGRVLVRRNVALRIPKGASTQHASLGAFDPGTLFSRDSGVVVVRAVYDGAVDEGSVLRRSVGRRVVFHLPESRDTVSALVLGVDPLRLQFPDGSVGFNMPGWAVYPADVAVAEPTVTLTLQSTRAVDQWPVGYFTTGASWQASYDVVLGARGTARVSGMAVLSSATLRAEEAEVQLLAGSVSRAMPPMPEYDMMKARGVAAAGLEQRQAMNEERVGEFHLYSLPGRSTLLPGLTTSVALFDPAQAAYEKRYVVHGLVPYWGFIPAQGEEAETPVEIRFVLKRPRKTDLGDRPLPGGIARLYEADSAGRAQLVGEARVTHTAPGHDLELGAGNAFDLTARRVQTAYSTRQDSAPGGGIRTIATADYRVTLRNETDTAVTIDVLEERAGEWSVLTSSVPADKISSTITRFRVPVPARGEAVLTYRIRAVW
jgi:hypothetical protein